MNTVLWILLFIVIICIVVVGALYLYKRVKYAGGDDEKVHYGGSPTSAALDAYETILPYVKEVGTSEHLERYLTELLGTDPAVSSWTRSQHVQNDKLLELLLEGAVQTGASDGDELIMLLDIKYLWVAPTTLYPVLMLSHQYNLGVRGELRDKVKSLAPSLNSTEIDKLVNKLLIVARSYYKLKPNFINKSAKVINEAKDEAFELDHVGIMAPIKYLIGCAKMAPKESIDDKLRSIDLMLLYPKDPLAVRNFITRIRRDISNLEDINGIGPFNSNGTNNLLKELKREQAIRNVISLAKAQNDLTKAFTLHPRIREEPGFSFKHKKPEVHAPRKEHEWTSYDRLFMRPEPEVTRAPPAKAPQVSTLTGKPVPDELRIPSFKGTDAELLNRMSTTPSAPKKRLLSNPL